MTKNKKEILIHLNILSLLMIFLKLLTKISLIKKYLKFQSVNKFLSEYNLKKWNFRFLFFLYIFLLLIAKSIKNF